MKFFCLFAFIVLAACRLCGDQTVIPDPKNRWEADHLFVIDKDTNSVFLNANPLYVRSLGLDFPQVKTVNDVIGKTDFDFYPKELAEKYRADDARVMASGERFETIEQYSEGDALGYVYTEKTPLRDGNGKVFGLRVRFYLIPKPGQTTIPEPASAWEQRHVFVIDKDTNSVFLNANPLYLQSLAPAFPEIQSVTNLIGRDDFAFYPPDLAEKYRADDARVMASGERFETIEQYSEGGSVGYVYTEKTPLKDGAGKVSGLRVRFYFIPRPNQTVIPEPANDWERRNVQIVDKDTQSICLNANELYLATTRAVFPEIQSVTNLIGRDDFAFYPTDLAEKYRADDARVIASGKEFSTVEENQLEGGVRRLVFVRKTPLRDSNGTIFALRIVFFVIPNLEVGRLPAGALELSWPEDATVFDLESAESVSGPWTPFGGTSSVSGGKIRQRIEPSGTARVFRLRQR
jgi:hypothetical protein